MRGRICLVALAAVGTVALLGCGGGGYETSSGFGQFEVNLSGRYDLYSKDPGVLPNFYSMQVFQSGNSLEGIDNLGRTWTGTMGNPVKYGVYTAGAIEQQQQQPQPGQQPQQQQEEIPPGWTAEIYLTTETSAGTITITGIIDTEVEMTATDAAGQQTTTRHVVIAGTVVDERGRAGSLTLTSYIGRATTTQP